MVSAKRPVAAPTETRFLRPGVKTHRTVTRVGSFQEPDCRARIAGMRGSRSAPIVTRVDWEKVQEDQIVHRCFGRGQCSARFHMFAQHRMAAGPDEVSDLDSVGRDAV